MPSRRTRTVLIAGLSLSAWILAAAAGNADPGESPDQPGPVAVRTADDGQGSLATPSNQRGPTNGDGFIDTITVTFNTPMDTSATPRAALAPGDPGLVVDGYQIQTIAWETATLLRLDLVQHTGTYDTGAAPDVEYEAGTVENPGGMATAAGFAVLDWTETAADGAGPVIKAFYANDQGLMNLFNAAGDETLIEFSEPATIAGASDPDQWLNLEKAIKFASIDNTGCNRDGIGAPQDRNFPQPGPSGVVDQPTSATHFVSVFRVSQKAEAGAAGSTPSHLFSGVPSGCRVSIHENFSSLITDAAGNTARDENQPAMQPQAGSLGGTGTVIVPALKHRVSVNVAEVRVSSVKTIDGATGSPDGLIDGLEVKLDQRVDDATLPGREGSFGVFLGEGSANRATVTAIESGTANDAIFTVKFTPPSGQQWDTVAEPSIEYQKPATCTATGGDGIKGSIPTPGYQACLASFSVGSTDGAGPVLRSSLTSDADSDGTLDGLRLTFSEAVAQGSASGWKVAGRNATAFTIDAADATKADLDFPEGPNADTGVLPLIEFTPGTSNADAAGNAIRAVNAPASADGAAPRLEKVTQYDLDGDGRIERAVAEFSESLAEPASGAAADFSVGGNDAAFASAAPGDDDPDQAGDAFLSLTFDALAGTGVEALEYAPDAGAIRDAAGNAATAQTIVAADVVDEALPVVTGVTPEGAIGDGQVTIGLRYSESMQTVSPTVRLGGVPVANAGLPITHTNGWRLDDPSLWEGTITVQPTACGVPTGCAVTLTATGAKDSRNNLQVDLSHATEIDTIDPQPPTIDAFAADVEAGESAPENVVNMFTDGFGVTATVTAGDAAGGSAELLVDGASLSPAAADGDIAQGDTTVGPSTAFASREDLQAAVANGAHTLSVKLCDDARNCATSASTLTVTADYAPVAIELDQPNGGELVEGGSTLNVGWTADALPADFDHVDLDYSADGGTAWSGIAGGQTDRDGAFGWTVPAIDSATARVRATSVDANGNKASDASADFSIDSTAPNVTITAPTGTDPFLTAGGTETIRWTAVDASIGGVTDPITIEFSDDRGDTWQEINAASYSKANDGEETWDVPAGGNFSTLVRVKAVDAVGNATTVVSDHLAKGAGGYVPASGGRIYAYGTAEGDVDESYTSSTDWLRGIALAADGTTGYVASQTGYAFPFAVGGAAMPPRPEVTRFSSDRARGIVLHTDTSGYVLHMWGRLYGFGGAPAVRYSKTWSTDSARGVVMLAGGDGGYVLTKYGRLYPFAIGTAAMPPAIQSSKFFSGDTARGVVLRSDERSGWVLDKYGNLKAFGGAPARTSYGTSSGANAKGLVSVTGYGGFWADGRGVLHRWGSADWISESPTITTLGTNEARGAVNFS